MYLYFKHGNGSLSFVAECAKEEASRFITDYAHKLNPNYKIHYIRAWGDDEQGYTYDIGSWSEFFKLTSTKQLVKN